MRSAPRTASTTSRCATASPRLASCGRRATARSSARKEPSMRFVERVAGRVGSVAVLATLAACSTFGGKAADSTAPEAAASTNAKPAATAKDSAAPAPSVQQPQLTPVSPAVQRAFDDARKALAAGRTAEAE